MATTGKQIRHVQRHLDEVANRHAGVQLRKTIPGVGSRTAETVVAYIDDPHRFKTNKVIGSYFGLVPTQDASGSVNRLGHITRNGPGTVRGLLTEAAWHGIRRSPRIRSYFDRIQRDDPDRPVLPDPCPWDLDASGDVGVKDLLILLAAWGPCP